MLVRPANLKTVSGVSKTNAFTSCRVFEVISHTNHSCSPNCFVNSVYTAGAPRTAKMETLRDVAAGEELCVRYTPNEALGVNRDEEQMLLRPKYGFDCDCAKCRAEKTGGAGELGRRCCDWDAGIGFTMLIALAVAGAFFRWIGVSRGGGGSPSLGRGVGGGGRAGGEKGGAAGGKRPSESGEQCAAGKRPKNG